MELIREARLRSVLAAGARLAEVDDLASLGTEVLEALDDVVQCDSATYNEVGSLGAVTVVGTPVGYVEATASLLPAFARLAWQNPLVARQAAGVGQAARLSSVISQRHLRQLELYQAVYRPLEVQHQLAVGVTASGGLVIGVALNRRHTDFTAEDAAALDLLRPHLGAAYRRAAARAQLRGLFADSNEDPRGQAAALVDDDGNLVEATVAAQRLLGTGPRTPLPEPLRGWFWRARGDLSGGPATWRVRHLGQQLDVRLSQQEWGQPSVLFLRVVGETNVRAAGLALGLSSRESVVLGHLVCGAQTAEIARDMQISRRTVEKHLEHIYRKLEVSNRTQAIQRGLSEAAEKAAK
jgi:DNA-binding CsgD family transcriptional regulator